MNARTERLRGVGLACGLLVLGGACDRQSDAVPAQPPAAPSAAETDVDDDRGASSASKPDAKPTEPKGPDVPALAGELVETMEALAKVHVEHGEDCEALAPALEAFAKEHEATLTAQTPQIHAWIETDATAHGRMRAAMETVMTGGMTCRDHAGVKAFYATRTSAGAGRPTP